MEQQGTTGAVASAQNRYDRGAGNILEMLSVQSSLTDAQQERIQCVMEWCSARLKLMANTGMLGHDLVVDEAVKLKTP